LEGTVFSLLPEEIRSALADLGFSKPTEPQRKAIPHILRGENVLLIGPTGSGKTEAALLPAFSMLLKSKEEKGIRILYITPLRALNRDMLRRIAEWSGRLGFSVEVRHGDTALKIRRRQAVRPPAMLITTPETLQAILPGRLMRENLRTVRFVIVDEVHEIAESKRGVQLAVALERLREVTGEDFQRVGLSATIGSPEKAAGLIGGSNRRVRVIQAFPEKRYEYFIEYPLPGPEDYDLAADLLTAPEAAARIRRILEMIRSHVSTLIFVNSRTNAEMLGHRLGSLSEVVAVHHGSLSREERHRIEDDFKEGTLKALICTSTLELGIDIGHVDFTVQYLSPRQVSALIQRVGRSGHRLDAASRGVIITAFPDDLLEAMATVRRAYRNQVEPTVIHEGALDVLAHQIAGLLMDRGEVSVDEALRILMRAYPYRKLTREMMLEVVKYMNELRLLWVDGEILRRTRRTRRYYYENLSMIPDERRYPVIDIISDRKIGTVGEEFMALRARVGLNFLCRGKVWRIVQIEDETGRVYVVPSEDPLAAAPGWDGEMIPIPQAVAEEVGRIREEIAEDLKTLRDADAATERIAKRYSVRPEAVRAAVEEIHEHLRRGLPVPTHRLILIEAYGKYVIIHSCFGEIVNVTLGCIFDSVLSDRELITGWWNDGYRILIEAPRKIRRNELEHLASVLFGLSEEEIDEAFTDYLKGRFPFAERLKFVAERFGALPRGRLAGPRLLSQITERFKGTPVYEETLREVMTERVDLAAAKRIISQARTGSIRVRTLLSEEKPSPLAFHILEKYADIPELMAPRRVVISNLKRMKMSIESRKARILCISCGEWICEKRIRELPERPTCGRCDSGLLAVLGRSEDAQRLAEILKRRKSGGELTGEELKELSKARRTADLVLSYGKKAIVALQVKGVGPETAFRILGRMHFDEDEFYLDLLKAKIQFLRTRQYWDEKPPIAP
jgi:ATP-dependent Lhr-like helicase